MSTAASGIGRPLAQQASGFSAPNGRYLRLPLIASALAISLIAAAVRLPLCTNRPLRSDAADYLRSVKGGLATVYLDSHSDSIVDFSMLARSPNTTDGHLWSYLYHREDAAALRHFHSPLAFYLHAIAQDLFPEGSMVHRCISAMIGSLTCGLVVVLLVELGMGRLSAMLLALAVATNPMYVTTTTDLSPHPLFILCALVFLWLWGNYLKDGRILSACGAAAVFACGVATLELAPALLIAAGSMLAITWSAAELACNGKRALWRTAELGLGIVLVTSFVIWPGGVIRGGYLKSYGVFIYQGLFKRGEMFGKLTARGVYEHLFTNNPIVLFGVAAALVATVVWWKQLHLDPRAVGLIIYSVIATLINLGNRFRNDTYASEVLVFLLLSAGVTLHAFVKHVVVKRRAPCWGIAFGLAIGTIAPYVWADSKLPSRESAAGQVVTSVLEGLPLVVRPGSTILANEDAETYRLYLSGYRFEGTENPQTLRPQSGGRWDASDCMLLNSGILDAVSVQAAYRMYSPVAVFGLRKGSDERVLLCHNR